MKKVLSVLAIVVMSLGLFSCDADNNAEETQALYENLATDGNDVDFSEREATDGNDVDFSERE
ncbi:MAG: hypothetical protein V3U92_12340 [Cellulophaga sp.]